MLDPLAVQLQKTKSHLMWVLEAKLKCFRRAVGALIAKHFFQSAPHPTPSPLLHELWGWNSLRSVIRLKWQALLPTKPSQQPKGAILTDNYLLPKILLFGGAFFFLEIWSLQPAGLEIKMQPRLALNFWSSSFNFPSVYLEFKNQQPDPPPSTSQVPKVQKSIALPSPPLLSNHPPPLLK